MSSAPGSKLGPYEIQSPLGGGVMGELFFSDDIGEVMAADVRESGAALQLGTPQQILKVPMVGGPEVPFAVSPDGKRPLVNQTANDALQLPLAIVTNWTAELK